MKADEPISTIILLTDNSLHYSRQVTLGARRLLDGVTDAPPSAILERKRLGHERWHARLPGRWAAVGFADPADLQACEKLNIPAVFCNTSLPGEFPRVIPDPWKIGQVAGEHLAAKGHRNVGFLTYEGHNQWAPRGEGLAKAIQAVGGTVRRVCWTGDATPELADALADLTAVMLPTDSGACRFIRVTEEMGIAVPDDLAVISADNDTFACELADVPLTSVELSPQRVGRQAAQLLLDAIRGGQPPAPQTVFVTPGAVRVRRSTDVLAYEDPSVRSAMAFILDRGCENITVEDVMAGQDVSRRTLENRFKRDVGRTLLKQIHHVRFETAKRLLCETDLRITDVAHRCGYPDHCRFSTEFGKHVGMTPSAYRTQHGHGEGVS
jgi:LacI family transcriptional regulator